MATTHATIPADVSEQVIPELLGDAHGDVHAGAFPQNQLHALLVEVGRLREGLTALTETVGAIDAALTVEENAHVSTQRELAKEVAARITLDRNLADLRGRLLWYEAQVPAVADARREYERQEKQRRRSARDGILSLSR